MHFRRGVARHARYAPAGERMQERTHHVAGDERAVAEQRRIERTQRLGRIGALRGRHLAQHVRMAADRALPEDDEAARQDVGALDGDRHRVLHVGAAQEIRRPHADALAADDVHRVGDHIARTFGDVVFGNGGDD
jgi:hypothetical protein